MASVNIIRHKPIPIFCSTAEVVMSYNYGQNEMVRALHDSSTGFHLPNTAILSPDASWVLRWRYDQLTNRAQERFLPLCPDFVIELKSPSDRIPVLKKKMEEYIDNGLQLGWLMQKTVSPAPVEVLENPSAVSADPVLPGFVLDLSDIW